jgi:hypothetical protein
MARKPTNKQRGYTSRWDRLSRRARAHARFCAICGQAFTKEDPASTDHLDPISEFGPRLPSPDRIQVVHRSCNSRRARQLEQQARARARPELELDGELDRPAPPPRVRVGSSRYPRVWLGALDVPVDGPADVIKPGGILIRVERGHRYVP